MDSFIAMLFGQKSDTDVSLLSGVSNLPKETFTCLLPAEGRRLYSGAWVGTRVPAPSASAAMGLRPPRGWDPGRQRTRSDGAAGRASREAPRAGDCPGGRREARAEAAAAQAHRPRLRYVGAPRRCAEGGRLRGGGSEGEWGEPACGVIRKLCEVWGGGDGKLWLRPAWCLSVARGAPNRPGSHSDKDCGEVHAWRKVYSLGCGRRRRAWRGSVICHGQAKRRSWDSNESM